MGVQQQQDAGEIHHAAPPDDPEPVLMEQSIETTAGKVVQDMEASEGRRTSSTWCGVRDEKGQSNAQFARANIAVGEGQGGGGGKERRISMRS